MTAPAIIIEKLTKIYAASSKMSEKIALRDLDLQVPEGSIFALLGPNGAGKSTLINILAGTVIKTSGHASIMGYDIEKSPKIARSNIGIVPQEVAFDSFFPIWQTLEFTAGYFGVRSHARKTDEILKALGLWDKRNALPRQLSGGMKRRFLIAKAMVHSPSVLILDEPTAGVDIELREQLWALVKKLNNEGTTIIITTHYLAEAEELCDRIAFINHGRIIKEDSKDNLLNELGAKYIEIEFDQQINESLKNFNEQFEILALNKIRFQFNTIHRSLDNLLRDLQKLGLTVKNIQINQADLENIFKQLMKND
jgi:ABC-2 type transport system ATP-binding protein